MRARRVDQNLSSIVEAARKAGFLVYIRNDVWDLDVTLNNRTEIWEVKRPKGTHTEAQERLLKAGWPVHTIRTVDDVLEARNRFLP